MVSLTCRYLNALAQANPIWFALYCSRWAVPASGRIKICCVPLRGDTLPGFGSGTGCVLTVLSVAVVHVLAFFQQCPEWSWRQLYMEKRSKEYDADRAAIQHQISLVAQQATPRRDASVRKAPKLGTSRAPFRATQLREALSTRGAKIVVLGATGIGKSHFISRFMQSPPPPTTTASSAGNPNPVPRRYASDPRIDRVE